jgi:hypothetical protein
MTAYWPAIRNALHRTDRLAHREWRWIVVMAWVIIVTAYLIRYQSSIHYFALGDTDDNIRYAQVRDWLAGQSWWDLRQYRLDPPGGADIHWSRLVDLPLAGLMLLLRLFMDSGTADRWACGIAPLLPLLPLMLSLAFLTRRLAEGGHGWFFAMLLPLAAGMGFSMYMPMRVDHHGWQLALTAMTLAGLVDRRWVRGGILAGVSSALSVAIGMEMMVYLAGAGALIALRWVFKEGAARRLQPYALSLGGTTALAYAGFASNANRIPVCDALSPVWTSILVLASGVLLLITLLPLRGWPQRLLAGAVGGAVVGGFAYMVWPECLTGAYQISAELERSWLVYIREAKPISAQPLAIWLPTIALPAAGLLCALIGCWSARRDRERLWAWGTVMLMVSFAVALTFWQIRAGPAAQILAIPAFAWGAWALIALLVAGPGIVRRAGAVTGMALMVVVANIYFVVPLAQQSWQAWSRPPAKPTTSPMAAQKRIVAPTSAKPAAQTPAAPAPRKRQTINQANGRCRALPALSVLDQLPPATIITMVDLGPRIIAMTHHRAIAGPYHRNERAILDIHHAMDGSPERFRNIAAAHGASLLLICPNFPEGTIYQSRSPRGFYARMMRGETFPFLSPVALKTGADLPYQLYRLAPLSPAAR